MIEVQVKNHGYRIDEAAAKTLAALPIGSILQFEHEDQPKRRYIKVPENEEKKTFWDAEPDDRRNWKLIQRPYEPAPAWRDEIVSARSIVFDRSSIKDTKLFILEDLELLAAGSR